MRNGRKVFAFVELEKYPFEKTKEVIPVQLFFENLCIREDDHILFKFSGVVMSDIGIIVVLPKGYVVPNDEERLKNYALTLLNVLMRYRQEHKLERFEQRLLGGIGENESIAAAFWILRDYFDYGFIRVQKESHTMNENNHINWNRTIKQLNPILSNGQPVYLDFITKKRHIDHASLVYRIHKHAVYKSLSHFGWFFGLDSVEEEIELSIDKDTAVYYLQLELQQTFVEREIELYKNLIAFFKGSTNVKEKDQVITFLTPYFHTVWEKICDFIFEGTTDNEIIMPRPFWCIDNEVSYTKQIPDTIFIHETDLFILDAKYYRIEKLPGWSDLVKQFFYANTLKVDYYKRNMLIFPKINENGQLINYLGYAAIENNEEFGKITGYILDIDKAMRSYANYERGDFKTHLIQLEDKYG